jgi:DNA polymerase-3 subunit epsilon
MRRIVAGFDTETTGLSFEKGHRIIEVAFIGFDLDTREKVFAFEKRINPGRSIDAKAQLVHKISQSDLVGCPDFAAVEPFVTNIFEKSCLVVAHNITFDAEFLIGEYGLIRKKLPNTQGFDTMSESRSATALGKNPNLEELCYACDVPYDRHLAHGALYDVDRMIRCFFYGMDYGLYNVEKLIK